MIDFIFAPLLLRLASRLVQHRRSFDFFAFSTADSDSAQRRSRAQRSSSRLHLPPTPASSSSPSANTRAHCRAHTHTCDSHYPAPHTPPLSLRPPPSLSLSRFNKSSTKSGKGKKKPSKKHKPSRPSVIWKSETVKPAVEPFPLVFISGKSLHVNAALLQLLPAKCRCPSDVPQRNRVQDLQMWRIKTSFASFRS